MPPSPLTASVIRNALSLESAGLMGRPSSAKAVGWNCTNLSNDAGEKKQSYYFHSHTHTHYIYTLNEIF